MTEDEYISYRRRKTRLLFLGCVTYACGCEKYPEGYRRCWESEEMSPDEYMKHISSADVVHTVR